MIIKEDGPAQERRADEELRSSNGNNNSTPGDDVKAIDDAPPIADEAIDIAGWLLSGYGGFDGAFIESRPMGTRADGKIETKIRKVDEALTGLVLRDHDKGLRSIGIYPINIFGQTKVGVIDIDDFKNQTADQVDAKRLAIIRQIRKHNLPLHPFKSKSGGLHATLFLQDYHSPDEVQDVLRAMAAKIGYPDAELFPVQRGRVKYEKGEWSNPISLPLCGEDRPALDDEGRPIPKADFVRSFVPVPTSNFLELEKVAPPKETTQGPKGSRRLKDKAAFDRRLNDLAEGLRSATSRRRNALSDALLYAGFAARGLEVQVDDVEAMFRSVWVDDLYRDDREFSDFWPRRFNRGLEAPLSDDSAASGGSTYGEPVFHFHDYAMPAAPKWLVKGLLPEVAVGLLPGQYSSGKTFVALDLAGCIMTGRPFAGRRVKRIGGVLVVAAESPGSIPVRLNALVEHKLALGPDDLFRGERKPLPFLWVTNTAPLRTGPELFIATLKRGVELMRQKQDVDVALVIVDTMSAAAGFENENESGQAQPVMNTLAAGAHAINATVLVVDHFGKDPSKGTRGSSAKPASADAELSIVLENKEASPKVGYMQLTKARDAESGMKTYFMLRTVQIGIDEDGDPITSCVVDWDLSGDLAAKAKAAKPSGRERKHTGAELLGDLIARGDGLPAPYEPLRQAFIEAYGKGEGAGRKALVDARANLGIVIESKPKGDVLNWAETPI